MMVSLSKHADFGSLIWLFLCFFAIFASSNRAAPRRKRTLDYFELDLGDSSTQNVQELIFKPDTNERFIAAEKAIGDGKKAEKAENTFDLSDFYNPNSWESMLTDDDYRELEENRQSAKAQKWAQEKKRDKEAFDFENTQESDENEAENEDLDDDMEADYEPVEVPSAEVELDGSSADATGNQIDRYGPEDDEASAEDTAERASSWMDVFGADPEFARETAEEDEVKSSYMKSMLPAEDYTNERTVDLLDSEDMSDEGKVSDVEPADYDNKRRRKKRSYKYYDDDYASAQLDDDGMLQEEDDKETSNLSDEAQSAEVSRDNEFEQPESEELSGEAKEPINREYAEHEAKNADTEDDNLLAEDEAAEDVKYLNDAIMGGYQNSNRKTEEFGSFDDDYGASSAYADQDSRQSSDAADSENDNGMSAESDLTADDNELDETAYRRFKGYRAQSGDAGVSQSEDNVYAGDVDVGRSTQNQQAQYATGLYPDAKNLDEADTVKRKNSGEGKIRYRPRGRQAAQNHEEISADADSDYVYRSDFDNYEKTHFPPKFAPAAADVAVMEGTPVKKAQVLKAPALVPASSKIALALRKSGQRDQQNNDEAFDDEEYEFDSEGTVEYARQRVCSFVAQQLPSYGFTGAMKGSNSECDVLCERTSGKQAVLHTFHLKNWPCGKEQKDRCSNDGKCDSVSKKRRTK